jgi:hypothetical protein
VILDSMGWLGGSIPAQRRGLFLIWRSSAVCGFSSSRSSPGAYLDSSDCGSSGVWLWTGASMSDASIVKSKSWRLGTGLDNANSVLLDPFLRYHHTPSYMVTGVAPL